MQFEFTFSSSSLSKNKSQICGFMRHRFRYDVFLSFRGSDTRYNFISHLLNALRNNKYQVFHDTSLPRGQGIGPQLLKAIKESQIWVVVFSTRYANSKWCLDELSQMMLCKQKNDQQILLPIFLDVKQSDVHGPSEELMTKFDQKRVQEWTEALQEAAKLPGLHLQDDANGYEDELLRQILEKIKMLCGQPDLEVSDPRHVGIETRVQEVISLLNTGTDDDDDDDDDDVRVVVIHGPAGIGKTTIAKATYDHLSKHSNAWPYNCFLQDVKAKFGEACGKLTLQKQLISDLFQIDKSRRIHNHHQGINEIAKMIKDRKLLLVLDDVDDEEQVKVLGMSRANLGPGSRLIVTTRDESNVILDRVKPYATYEPRLLDVKESLEVFCMNAFGQAHPKDGYEDVSRNAACWDAGWGAGYPGLLKDLGAKMSRYQSVEQWECVLRYVKQNPSRLTDESSL